MVPILNAFGEGATFHHIGIAVKKISAVCRDCKVYTDKIQEVSVAFMDFNGIQVELIEPLFEESPITQSLKKGTKLVHMCYEVPDIDKSIRACKKNRFHLIAKPAPAVAFNARRIVWVFHKHFGLYELLEK